MCNLFDQQLSLDDLLALYEIQEIRDSEIALQPGRFPHYDVAVITSGDHRVLEMARWGLIAHWNKTEPPKAKQFNNARSETAHEKSSFRLALQHHRGVIPANLIAENEGPKGQRTPIWFSAADDSVLSVAALYWRWKAPDGTEINTSTMLTSEPNGWFSRFHNRSLVYLETQDEVDAWLDNDHYDLAELQELMQPASEDFLKVVARANGEPIEDA